MPNRETVINEDGTPAFDETGNAVTKEVGKTLAIDLAERAVIEEAAERALAKDSLGSIVRWLNESGHKPGRAKWWSRVTLRQDLR